MVQGIAAVDDGIGDKRQQFLANAVIVCQFGLHIDVQAGIGVDELCHQTAQAGLEVDHVLQITHAQAIALSLVAVGRSDALERGANLLASQLLLLVAVDGLMEIEHNVSAVAQVDAVRVVDVGFTQSLQLRQQATKVHDHTVSNHAVHASVQNTRRDQVKLVFLAL